YIVPLRVSVQGGRHWQYLIRGPSLPQSLRRPLASISDGIYCYTYLQSKSRRYVWFLRDLGYCVVSIISVAESIHTRERNGSDSTSDSQRSKVALKHLLRHFGSPRRTGPAGHACVVLMDKLDQLTTAKLDVVFNFFNWPTLTGAKFPARRVTVFLALGNCTD
ncbi:hypothetical protein V8E52_002044, partial [Russula decolorans]